MADETDTRPFAAILGRFPDLAALARALDLPHATVAAWKRRDSVPESRWRGIAEAAGKLKVKGVTYRRLSEASAAKAAGGVTDGRASRHSKPSRRLGSKARLNSPAA